MMTKFEVGQEFPSHNRARGIEESRIDMNESFFDFCFYSAQADEDKAMFTKKPIKYGLYVQEAIPFFIVEFSEMSCDASINFLKVMQDKADDWLNSEGNIINFYLIDAKTNILKGMRTISVQKAFAELVRDTCEAQDEKYSTHTEVESIVNRITLSMQTSDMIKKGKMYKL
jgi:hypothetical protein